MASSRMIALLLAGLVLPALSGAPCATVAPIVAEKKGLTDEEIAGIAVGSAAAVATIGGLAGGLGHKKKEENAGSAEEPEIKARAGSNATEPPATEPPASITTTLTAFDFSSSSGSQPSASLGSIGSGAEDSSAFNQGSWADSSGLSGSSVSSGHNGASGSLGSQLPIWLWVLVLALCCCLAGGGAMMGGGKKRSKKKKSKAAAPEPAAVAEVEPLLMEIPPLMPMATTSQLIPSYSMVAAPQAYTTYAAPATTAYATAAPATMAYAQPAQMTTMSYAAAAPATTAYAQPIQAGYTYAAPATSGFAFETTTGQVV